MLWEISILTKGGSSGKPPTLTPLLLTTPPPMLGGREETGRTVGGWEWASPPGAQHSASCIKQEGPFPQPLIKTSEPKDCK